MEGNKILFHIHQNPLTRVIEVDKLFDARDKNFKPKKDESGFPLDQNGNYIFEVTDKP